MSKTRNKFSPEVRDRAVRMVGTGQCKSHCRRNRWHLGPVLRHACYHFDRPFLSGYNIQEMVRPPSAITTSPVTNEAASDASHMNMSAISAG